MKNTYKYKGFGIMLWTILFCSFSMAQTSNLSNLLNASQWDALFPKRAGTFGTHPQGYTSDFYSFQNLTQAATEMSDYLVEIKIKEGVWGQLITITKKSTNQSYNYSDVDSWWLTNPTPETIINVDFEDFINRGSSIDNKRELGAFLANISKETTGGWQVPIGGGSTGDYAQWGLYFVHELGYTSANSPGVYSQSHAEYPPNPAVGYYGRGPIQLSWNYNYGQLSKFLYNDKTILLNNPNAIQEEGVLAFKSAIWFWMMPQCPKPSCHQVMHDLWLPEVGEYAANKMYKKGFAHTNNIINGGLECRSSSTAAFTEKVVLRAGLYEYYLQILGLTSNQIALENANDYTTFCYESSANAMQDYANCFLNNSLGTNEKVTSEIQIFPNPASQNIYVSYSKNIMQIKIMNSTGQEVMNLNPDKTYVEIPVSDFIPGFYLMKIYSENRTFTKSIIVTE